MQWLIVALVLCCRACLSAGTDCDPNCIGIYPPDQYFGGGLTKPTITCKPSASCGTTIKWFFGQIQVNVDTPKYDTSLNFVTHYQTLTVNEATADDAGFYHCQCTFSGQAINSPDAELRHTVPVSFDTEDNIIYQKNVGDNVTLVCDIQDYVQFQWQFSDKTVIPSNNGKYQYQGTNLFINDLSISDNMTYYCAANNQITNVEKLGAQLLIYKQPNTVVNGDSVVMIDEGDSVTLNCTADGFPRPSIIWSRTGAVLNIGGRITKHEENVDEYTRKSSLTIKHVSSSDEGHYSCTGQSNTLDKFATSAQMFTLTVVEPPGPLFQIFTIGTSHSSINISWILSGVTSDMINVSWGDDQSKLHFSNLSSIVIEDLFPNTHYQITAQVIGTQLTDTLNESTDPLDTITVTSATVSTLLSIPIDSTIGLSNPSVTSAISTTTTTQLSRRSRTTSTVTTSTRNTRPEPTVRGVSASSSSLTTTAIPVAVLLVLGILIVVVVIALVCAVRRSRNSKVKNIQSIERANSSRSDQVLISHNSSFSNINSQFYPASPSIASGTVPRVRTSSGDFDSSKHYPPDISFQSVSNHNSHAKLPLTEGGIDYIVPSADEPFQMTDNPVNAEYEVAQSSQLHLHPISCDVFEQTPVGDSISQVIFTSQSQNIFDTYHPYEAEKSQQSFDYTPNLCYEAMPSFKQDSRALSEPPSSINKLPVYENNDSTTYDYPKSPPVFGIVSNSRRGDVREQVEIKRR